MNIWRIASRWSENGEHGSTILDIFLKNQVAFFYPRGAAKESWIKPDDLIAIADGFNIVAVAKATSQPMRLSDLPGLHLSQRDQDSLGHPLNEIVGVKITFRPQTLLEKDKWIRHPARIRFCSLDQHDVREQIVTIWNDADEQATKNDFQIGARTSTLHDLLVNNKTKLYLISVFQRPYSWAHNEVERFLRDIITACRKQESMFAGTMQLSGLRVLSPRGEWFQEVIDGQQRLTTCLLTLKALQLLMPGYAEFDKLFSKRDWLETKVSGGEQQKALDAVMHANALPDKSEPGMNRYRDNLQQIYATLLDATQSTTMDGVADNDFAELPLDLKAFANHFLKKMQFVVIETEAGISKTIQIFNVINTTGLDLNGSDLFKVRMFEYLTDMHGHLSDCFAEIDRLYKIVEQKNSPADRLFTNIQEILWIYQKLVCAKHHLPIALVRAGTETFYERLFDGLLGIKYWEGYKTAAQHDQKSAPLLRLSDIERLIDLRRRSDQEWHSAEPLTWHHRLAIHLIEWSRYSNYWYLRILVDYCYPTEIAENSKLREEFATALARVCVVYSVINARKINEMHSFFADLSARMFDHEDPKLGTKTPLTEIITRLNDRIKPVRQRFENELAGDLSAYLTAKNLVCRMVEALFPSKPIEFEKIFCDGYDIEHICSYHDKDNNKREDVWQKWKEAGVSINGLGNLMLLEYKLNRSIKNDDFDKKRPKYVESKLREAEFIAALPNSVWSPKAAESKLERNTKRLIDYLFPSEKF
jgi:hypothetical protein